MRYNVAMNPRWVQNNLTVGAVLLLTFCEHGEISEPAAVREWLRGVVRELIAKGADVFYLGGYGAFDSMAAAVIREEKKAHTNLEMVQVLPYLNSNTDTSGYDYTVYPPLPA